MAKKRPQKQANNRRSGRKKRPDQPSERNADGTFAAGVSGNPSGRPKGASLTSILRNCLDAEDAKSGKLHAELLIEALIREGKKGSSRHAKLIFDRIDGPVRPVEEKKTTARDVAAEIEEAAKERERRQRKRGSGD